MIHLGTLAEDGMRLGRLVGPPTARSWERRYGLVLVDFGPEYLEDEAKFLPVEFPARSPNGGSVALLAVRRRLYRGAVVWRPASSFAVAVPTPRVGRTIADLAPRSALYRVSFDVPGEGDVVDGAAVPAVRIGYDGTYPDER